MAHEPTTNTLYLRLPARGYSKVASANAPLALALSMRGRPLRTATASLSELAPQVAQVAEVVVLLSASDVTLLRLAVPPLSEARLQAALPSLVEDRVIGDTADCAIGAGPEVNGQRLIAVCDRAWLQSWIDALRQLGARRVRALPMSLCLPTTGTPSAALISHANRFELALRLSDDGGVGLPVDVEDESELPGAVVQLLSTMAAQRPVQLSVPAAQIEWFRSWIDARHISTISITEQSWSDWIRASASVNVDLSAAIGADQRSSIDWQAWRWPMALAMSLALFNLIALNADWWQLRSEGMKLRDEMVDIYRRSFPNEKVVLDPLAQMKQKIVISHSASGQLTSSDFVVLTAALGEAWREAGNDLRAITSLEYREGTLNVKLKQGVQVSLEALRAPLATRQLQLAPSPSDPLLWQVRSL